MPSQQEHISELWDLYLKDQASMEQVEELFALLRDPAYDADNDQQFRKALMELAPSYNARTPEADIYPWESLLNARESLWEAWESRERTTNVPAPVRRITFFRKWGWAAASIILLLGMGVYFRTIHKKITPSLAVAQQSVDIAPGRDGAVLTLADGSQVLLDTVKQGTLALQGGATVKMVDKKLVYEAGGTETVYNTMSTPKGRQFQLSLPDGTQVWLNSVSAIRYPVAFTGGERKVSVTGEAYFEVASRADMPFRVEVNGKAEVEVLGTHFNVNAYENEKSINTTLLEGAVRVMGYRAGEKKGEWSGIIRPGEQASLSSGATHVVIQKADTEKVMAWKNGLFNFNGLPFEEIMRQLERWYDIEVVYENNKIPAKHLAGKITRGVSLNGLLKNLEKLGVRYRLEDRRLIILSAVE